tara:strand:- start:6298 stop:6783 length:486 start_codon:yes stop_codon:yes gene_type:complete
MTISIQVSTNIDKNLKQADELYTQNAVRHINRVANFFRNAVLLSMQQTKTRTDDPVRRGGVEHFPSLEGNPPAIDTGRLASSIKVKPANKLQNNRFSATIETPIEYAKFLEEKRNRPFMKKGSIGYNKASDFAKKIQKQISISSSFRPVKVMNYKTGIKIK